MAVASDLRGQEPASAGITVLRSGAVYLLAALLGLAAGTAVAFDHVVSLLDPIREYGRQFPYLLTVAVAGTVVILVALILSGPLLFRKRYAAWLVMLLVSGAVGGVNLGPLDLTDLAILAGIAHLARHRAGGTTSDPHPIAPALRRHAADRLLAGIDRQRRIRQLPLPAHLHQQVRSSSGDHEHRWPPPICPGSRPSCSSALAVASAILAIGGLIALLLNGDHVHRRGSCHLPVQGHPAGRPAAGDGADADHAEPRPPPPAGVESPAVHPRPTGRFASSGLVSSASRSPSRSARAQSSPWRWFSRSGRSCDGQSEPSTSSRPDRARRRRVLLRRGRLDLPTRSWFPSGPRARWTGSVTCRPASRRSGSIRCSESASSRLGDRSPR